MPQLNTESSHEYVIQLMVGEFTRCVLEISERPSYAVIGSNCEVLIELSILP